MKRFLSDLCFFLLIFLAMLGGAFFSTGCATVAPGEDKIAVRAQQALKAADTVYVAAMKVYFALPAQSLTAAEVKVFEAVRTGYDGAYKALDTGLTAYKAHKQADIFAEQKALSDLLNQIVGLVAKYGGPALEPVPPPAPAPARPTSRWGTYRFPAEVYA
jgi:hypothetical protein